MKQLDPKDTPEVSGGEATPANPPDGMTYPIQPLPDPGQPNKAFIIPEAPLP